MDWCGITLNLDELLVEDDRERGGSVKMEIDQQSKPRSARSCGQKPQGSILNIQIKRLNSSEKKSKLKFNFLRSIARPVDGSKSKLYKGPTGTFLKEIAHLKVKSSRSKSMNRVSR